MEERRLALSQAQASTNLRLDGKVALVTGGGSGIGQAIAVKFAAHGATVRVLDVSLGAAEETCRQIISAGGKASVCACDVTDQKLVKEMFTQLAAHGPLSILVNNAGISHIGTVESTTEEDFDRVFRVNVKGYYNCMQAAVASMKAQGGGVILNMASIAGSVGLCRPLCLFHEQSRRDLDDLFGRTGLPGLQDPLQLHLAGPRAHSLCR